MSAYIHMASAQFENANALRSYPFQEGSTLVDDLGRRLPDNVVADLHMFVPADMEDGVGVAVPEVKMTSVHLSQSMVSVCFVSKFGGISSALSVTVAAANLRPYVPYRLEKLVGSYDVGGIVTFGEMELPAFPETYRFNPDGDESNPFNPYGENAIVHPCCIAVAKPAGLRGFVDRRSGERVSGDVRIDFSGYVETEKNGKSFRLSLSEDAASELMPRCEGLPDGVGPCGATPIRTINGVRPDEEGNIVLWFH